MSKAEELEAKIHRVLERLAALKKEAQQLRSENESLKAHVALLSGENNRAQRILTEYQDLKRKQEQVTHRVERALNALNTLRQAS